MILLVCNIWFGNDLSLNFKSLRELSDGSPGCPQRLTIYLAWSSTWPITKRETSKTYVASAKSSAQLTESPKPFSSLAYLLLSAFLFLIVFKLHIR